MSNDSNKAAEGRGHWLLDSATYTHEERVFRGKVGSVEWTVVDRSDGGPTRWEWMVSSPVPNSRAFCGVSSFDAHYPSAVDASKAVCDLMGWGPGGIGGAA